MNRCSYIAALAGVLAANIVLGHGHPIHVEVDSDRLVVSAGVVDTNGFASQLYFETDSAGDPEDVATFNGFGQAAYWTVPGLDIFGLAENRGLYLEVLARPVKNAASAEQRLLWYWNPSTEEVRLAPTTQLQIRKSASVNILLTPETTAAPPPIKIAAPLASDMGFHNHDLLRYLLPYPLPQAGAYGFFAQLTSDVYEPSDPFLVVLNNGVAFNKMSAAALAINAAAADNPLLAGDYNNDGVVDAVDYTVWRNNLGDLTEDDIHHNGDGNNGVDATDYGWWKQHYGNMSPGSGRFAVSAPEPNSAALAWMACAAGLLLTGRRLAEIVPHRWAPNSSVLFAASRSIMPPTCCIATREVGYVSHRANTLHAGVYAHRDSGRDCDHWNARRADAAGDPAGARIGAQDAVRE